MCVERHSLLMEGSPHCSPALSTLLHASGALLWPPNQVREDSGVRRQQLCWGRGGVPPSTPEAGSSTPYREPGIIGMCLAANGENGRRVLGDLSPRLKTIDSTSKSTVSNDWQQKASVICTLGKGWCCLVLLGCSAVCRTPFTWWVWLANQPRGAESGW